MFQPQEEANISLTEDINRAKDHFEGLNSAAEYQKHRNIRSHYGRNFFTNYWKIQENIPRELVQYMRGDKLVDILPALKREAFSLILRNTASLPSNAARLPASIKFPCRSRLGRAFSIFDISGSSVLATVSESTRDAILIGSDLLTEFREL